MLSSRQLQCSPFTILPAQSGHGKRNWKPACRVLSRVNMTEHLLILINLSGQDDRKDHKESELRRRESRVLEIKRDHRRRKCRSGEEKAATGPSHYVFHPLSRTCIRLEECLVFTFPPFHSPSPHTLSQKHTSLPDLLALAPLSHPTSPRHPSSSFFFFHLLERPRLPWQSCNVIPPRDTPPSAICRSRRCHKHFACDRPPLWSNANSRRCLKECLRVQGIFSEKEVLWVIMSRPCVTWLEGRNGKRFMSVSAGIHLGGFYRSAGVSWSRI